MEKETETLQEFRRDVRGFCETALPPTIRTKVLTTALLEKDDIVRWQKILHEKGWFLGHWPKKHGGLGWSPLQRYAFLDETASFGAPRIAPFGVNYMAPVLHRFGTAEQCARFLPGIADSDTWWAQGYSEPGAGSDLAALSTRAVRDGDHYRVTGQKVWTTMAHWADMMFCLVRTAVRNKPQEGISFLLIDMTSPGITVRPIVTLDGCHETNEVFLDDVRVPAENLVGVEGEGWDCAKFLLDNERLSMVYYIGRIKLMLSQLRDVASRTLEAGRPVAAAASFWRSYADLAIAARAVEAVSVRQVGASGAEPAQRTIGASILKLRCTELTQQIAQAIVDVLGRTGLRYDVGRLATDGVAAPDEQAWTNGFIRSHLIGRASTIYGGSTEIQKNIITKALAL